MGNKRKKKEPTANGTIKVPEIYDVNVTKLVESLKELPQITLGGYEDFVINILHALGVDKHVVIEFNPDAYNWPLHTTMIISKTLEEKWGKDKTSEFTKEFYNNAMEVFARLMNTPGNGVLDSEALAVHLTALDFAGEYGFDAIIHLSFDPSKAGKDAYRGIWVLAKK